MALHDVLEAIKGTGPIPKERVLAWMRESSLETRAAAYALTAEAWARIVPELSHDEQRSFMADYLLECLLTDPQDGDWIHGGGMAGYELAAWLKHLAGKPDSPAVVASVAHRMALGFREGDGKTRARIETTALEHIFEDPDLRTYFSGWKSDPVLGEAYEKAVAWGDDHVGYDKKLSQQSDESQQYWAKARAEWDKAKK